MKNILAFTGSNSSTSINKQLLDFTIGHIKGFEVNTIDLRDYKMPIYSSDLENESGIPASVKELSNILQSFDYLIVATNEHNWTISAFFKNILDWLSRNDSKFMQDKSIFVLSTSPGRGGANSANDYLHTMLPKFGGKVTSHFALKSFYHSFSEEKGIYDEKQNTTFHEALNLFLKSIS